MYCPQCRTEYLKEFKRCKECNVPLVDFLPNEQESEFVKFTEVLSTSSPADIAMIKSLLDSESITYYFEGEHLTTLLTTPVLAAKLMVQQEQTAKTRDILKDIHLQDIELFNIDT